MSNLYARDEIYKYTNSYNVLLKKNTKEKKSKSNFLDINNSLLIIGDVIDCLQRIPDKSISVIVTSPPYWNLRDYNTRNQIGIEATPKEYIDKIIEVGEELKRVLKDDGAYFLNIGDTYVDKNLQMIPERIAIGMQSNGWLLRNKVVWYKPNHMPSPVKSRFKNTYEPIFFFTKNDWEKKVNFDLDAVRVPYKTEEVVKDNIGYNGKFNGENKNMGASPGARVSVNGDKVTLFRDIKVKPSELVDYLSRCMQKNDLSKNDLIKKLGGDYKYKVGHWFRIDGGFSYPSKNDWLKLKKILRFDSKYDNEMTEIYEKKQGIHHHPKGKNPGDFWAINTNKTNYKHFAIFPEKIPYIAIKSCCPEDGIVLDPFAGSGTTGKVASELNRKFILIDIQKKYTNIIKERVKSNFDIIK